MRAREAADYDASIAGWDFRNYSESYGPTDELRNKRWVGSFLLDKEWFDSSDRSFSKRAMQQCSGWFRCGWGAYDSIERLVRAVLRRDGRRVKG